MAFDRDLEGDFGPVRQATEAEIEQAALTRKSRRNARKSDDSHEASESKSTDTISKSQDAQNSVENAHLTTELTPTNQKVPVASRKRSLKVSGQEQLRQYLEQKERKKLLKKQQNSDHKKSSSKNVRNQRDRKLMLKPMDDEQRQKILARIRKNEEQKEPEEAVDTSTIVEKHTEVDDTEISGIIEIDTKESDGSSDSSEPEFEDAPQSPDDYRVSIESTESPQNSNDVVEKVNTDAAEDLNIITEPEIEAPIIPEDITEASTILSNEQPIETTPTVPQEDVLKIRKIILSQLHGNAPVPIENTCLEAPFKELYALLNSTVVDSESHTVLLTGAPGSGKTELVEQALAKLHKSNPEKYITIRLSGTLHFTDQHAIREIARQLDVKLKDFTEEIGEDTYEQREINETFHNILVTLFKLDDPNEPEDKKESSIRVIFIIDEMEKFTSNPRQTLLYNLFELAQISKVPICIVGVTPRVTLREIFEKRVRSRFSQRMIQTKRADSVESFWQDAKLALLVSDEKLSLFANEEYPKEWNREIEKLFETRSGLTTVVSRAFYATKNYRQVHNECALPVSLISTKSPYPNAQNFNLYAKNANRGLEAIVASLSRAELLAVVAAARWIAKATVPHVNFKLAYNEYTEMTKASNIETTTLSSKTSYIDNLSLAGIKITRNVYPAKMLRSCWRVVYRTGLLFDIISANNETNANNSANIYKEAMIDDSKMLQLDVTLEELGKLIPEDDYVRRFTRL